MTTGVVNCAVYTDGRRMTDIDVKEIQGALQAQQGFIWIGLHEPEEDVLREVQRQFGLHDLAIEDAHLAHQRPKLERYGDGLFIVLRTAQMNIQQHHIDFGETHLFVGPRYVVSVRHGSTLSYRDLRSGCERTPQLLRKGPGFVLYALMDFIVDQYFPVIDALEDELQELEERIFGENFSRDISRRIYELRREVLEVKRAVSPLVDVTNRLMRIDDEIIPDDTRPYFRDVYDHVIRINDMLDSVRDLLTAALEANLSLTAVSQNDAMKRLTAWAAIVAVPTMVGGIYGMNFKFMPELEWSFGYPLVMGVTVAACAFLFTRFKRTGWL
jgi:magnesium transporter